MERNELKLSHPVILRKFKWKFLSTKMKKKLPNLWVINEIKADERMEIENPYSRTTKLVIKSFLQKQ